MATTTALRVSTRFALRGVWVTPDALGNAFTWTVDDRAVTLTLPLTPQEFYNPAETEITPVAAWVHTARMMDSGEAVSVQLIRVDVGFASPISAAEKAAAVEAQANGNEEPIGDFCGRAESLWRQGNEIAVRAAHAWLSHVRVTSGQPWLGINVEPPTPYGRSHIVDVDADVRLMSFGPMMKATVRSGGLAMSLDQLQAIATKVAEQGEPPTAETLLADARFLSQEAEVVDVQRAVLNAASACEIKTKLVMRHKADAAKAELLDLVLHKVSSLHDLLDAPLLGALGVSLRQADPPLFENMKQLGELRNRVIHRGVQVTQAEGRRLVNAAGMVFQWLDQL